jgi:hypothetical protein
MVAEEVVIALTLTAEITGAWVRVVNVKFDEVADVPLELAETASKL